MNFKERLGEILTKQHMYGYNVAVGNKIENEEKLLLDKAVDSIINLFLEVVGEDEEITVSRPRKRG